jgi:hypothetical protein
MRVRNCLPLLLLAACASAPGASSAPVPDQTLSIPTSGVSTTMRNIVVASSASPRTRAIAAPADRVWSALPGVYGLLGLPVTSSDASTHVIAATSVKLRRRLGDVPLSRYLDCGHTQGAPSAETYEVLLSMETRMVPGAGDSTVVSTTLDAMARPVFVSSEYIHCGTTGALERRLLETIAVQTAR